MDAQSEIELARMQPNGGTATVDAAVREVDAMDQLLETIEAELALQRQDLNSWDFEESVRSALEGFENEPSSAAEPARVQSEAVDSVSHDMWASDAADALTEEPSAPVAEAPAAAAGEPAWLNEEPAAAAFGSDAVQDSLEAVELELALHNQNLVSLGFEESIRTALQGIGGEMLFQMRIEREDCQRIAAVRIGQGEEQQFALVIMPPGGGLMRVEPVEQSSNPLALITESYASLMDTFRAAA